MRTTEIGDQALSVAQAFSTMGRSAEKAAEALDLFKAAVLTAFHCRCELIPPGVNSSTSTLFAENAGLGTLEDLT